MKRVLFLLVAGTLISGVAAYAATARPNLTLTTGER